MTITATLDIGSTWTKGASFEVDSQQNTVKLLRRAARPTTVENLADAFFAVLDEIVGDTAIQQIQQGTLKLQYSSSAKGGLAVAAIGLVPEVTLEIGKIAAQSAGARLTQVFSYHLTAQDIAELERKQPDILLFAGGTDGGNSEYIIANAQKLAASTVDCEIVFAGNRSIADDVKNILAAKRLQVVDNLLPSFNDPNPEPAQRAIREIFLNTIVKGKGLDAIASATGAMPLPTPLVMLEYTQAIHEHAPDWGEFVVFDMGGATTDVYSVHKEQPEPGVILRNIYEPPIKRTVEGDLGMRVSAHAAARVDGPARRTALQRMDIDQGNLIDYADSLQSAPDRLPVSAREENMDTLLAGLCVGYACARHAGRWSAVYTPDGEVKVQTGRNLSRITKVIGAGGWLSRQQGFQPVEWFMDHLLDQRGRTVLVPHRFEYYRDEQSLFPLLANLAREYPCAAARAGVSMLVRNS